MLLECVDHLKKNNKDYRTLKLFGQENNLTSSSIARMNMFLHGYENAHIERGDTFLEPKHLEGGQLKKFDIVLANPPWIIKSFLDSKLYSCYGLYQDIESGFSRPFWAVQNVRNLKKGRSYKCDTMYESKFNLLFTNEDIITGRLIKCI